MNRSLSPRHPGATPVDEAADPPPPTVSFMRGVLRSPFATGAIAPSSRGLARLMVNVAGVADATCVVELGPGTGQVTDEIMRRKRPQARVLAIEWNAEFLAALQVRHPHLDAVCACASELAGHARERGYESAEAIVSGLPWTIFDPARQTAILEAARDLLTPGGVFATFACLGLDRLPSGRAFRRRLGEAFPHVTTTRVVWLNVPPVFVYVCRKEIPAAAPAGGDPRG